MKLIIELTNGKIDAAGDCECVSDMIAGEDREGLEKEFGKKMPTFRFEE